MNPTVERNKKNEMKSIWTSYEWLIKEKLLLIDDYARSMTAEMRTFGIPAALVEEMLPREYSRLMREVALEQEEKYSKAIE